jgi:hypothetical protein
MQADFNPFNAQQREHEHYQKTGEKQRNYLRKYSVGN